MVLGGANGLCIVAYDASLSRLICLTSLLQDGSFFDLGAIASKYGGVDNQPTCQVDLDSRPTMRDYVLANPEAEALIQS